MTAAKNTKKFQSNFFILKQVSEHLAKTGTQAENLFHTDPSACIAKLRALSEQIVLWLLNENKISFVSDMSNRARINLLKYNELLSAKNADHLHFLRMVGNRAAHENLGAIEDAHDALKMAHEVSVWLIKEYFDASENSFFVTPPAPVDASELMKNALKKLEETEVKLAKDAQARAVYEAKIAEMAAKLARPEIILYEKFADSLAKVPEDQQAAVANQIKELKKQGFDGQIQNFESVKDQKFGWVLLAGAYVLVVAASPDQDTFIFAWVDTLVGAQQWVQKRHVSVHPQLGALQIYEEIGSEHAKKSKKGRGDLFKSYDDEGLRLCAVPDVLLPAVKKLGTYDDLLALLKYLPPEASLALVQLADGKSLEEASKLASLGTVQGNVDTQNFGVASQHKASKQQFVALDSDEILDAILKAPLDKWRVFLHPDQQKLVKAHNNGPCRVMGGAGTGKTVALIHRAVYLIRHVFTAPEDRILVTTYTRNLSMDLKFLIGQMLSPEEMARVDVMNLHSWVNFVLRENKKSVFVATDQQQKQFMQQVIKETQGADAFGETLYHDEWTQVVQAQNIKTQGEYLTARREGRGTALNRKQRMVVWKVLEGYRGKLEKHKMVDWVDMSRMAKDLIQGGHQTSYRGVLVDEIQDFNAEELRLIRSMIAEGANDLFIVGDNHQRLYGAPVSFASCGIQIRGRSHRLTLNYRTTERIRQQAVKVLEGVEFGDQDGGEDHLKGYHSLRVGIDPVYHLSEDSVGEIQWIVEQLKSWLAVCKFEDICIATRMSWACEKYIKELKKAGVKAVALEVKEGTYQSKQEGVRVATMHRLKGTEFKRVILAGIQSGSLPWVNKSQSFADAASEEDFERIERSLFYVAATRARDILVISGYGERSLFLQPDNNAERLEGGEVTALVGIFEELSASVLGVIRYLLSEPPAPMALLEMQLQDYETMAQERSAVLKAATLQKVSELVGLARGLVVYVGEKKRSLTEQMLAQVAIRYLVLQDDAMPDFATADGLDDDAQVIQIVNKALSIKD